MKRDFSLFTGLLKTARTDDGMLLTGVASSTIKDRHGDTMTRNALDSMLRSANGLTIFLNHSYNVPEDVAGTVQRAWTSQEGELHDLHFEIAINDENPRAVQAFNAIDKGTKLGLSIGAMIPEGGAKRVKGSGAFVIDEVELLETSIVSIPANPRSWVDYARKSLLTKTDIPEVEDEEEEPINEGEDDPEVAAEPAQAVTYGTVPGEHFPSCNEQCDPATGTHYFEAELPEGEGTPVPVEDDRLAQAVALINDYTNSWSSTDLIVGEDGPEIAKNRVTVWPSGKVAIDTTPPNASSQEALPEAEPDTEEPSADDLSAALGEMARGIDPELQKLLGPTFMASLQASQQLLLVLVATVEKATERAITAERERDEVVSSAKVLIQTTEAFITRVSATPRGRRAIARELPKTAQALEGIRESGLYSDEFMDILEMGEPTSA
jgi:HK97 family phage prohead protease